MPEIRNAYRNLVRKSQAKDHLGDLLIDWKIILKWALDK
jgi:hypothetical protein